jgi:hypothetical protein
MCCVKTVHQKQKYRVIIDDNANFFFVFKNILTPTAKSPQSDPRHAFS